MHPMMVLVNKFKKTHKFGTVTEVNDYSFTWETFPDKNDKTQKTVYYESYFWKEV